MNGAKLGVVGCLDWSRSVTLIVFLAVALLLAGCGVDDADPTPAPTSAAPPDAPAPASTVVPASVPAGTPGPATTTVGQIAEAIAVGWPQTSYRRVQTGLAADTGATPATGMTSVTTTDEVLYPGRGRRTIVVDGRTAAEFLIIDGRVYARGELVPSLFGISIDPAAWIELDASRLQPDMPGGNIASQLMAMFEPRYAQLSPEQQAQAAVFDGEVAVEGRSCFVFQTAETTQTGERLEIDIAIEPSGQLCSVTTRGGGLEITEVFTYDVPVTIEAPADIATPVAPPIASPESSPAATPAG